eukprot:TRINITY_DN3873_c0_g1_i1.p2 TRINITY_DN3873_c0_g1~~TRINITY_DN3873_c0_g1_i1.p2  ORF type:complete len:136 (+),score=39.13 TRINITY_DN3873_c0_g1_i1:64-471(+)
MCIRDRYQRRVHGESLLKMIGQMYKEQLPTKKAKSLLKWLHGGQFAKENQDKIELVTLCPGFLLGPPLTGGEFMSSDVIEKVMTHQFPAIPKLQFQMVDVRDTAEAHILALTSKEAAGQRYIICLLYTSPSPRDS